MSTSNETKEKSKITSKSDVKSEKVKIKESRKPLYKCVKCQGSVWSMPVKEGEDKHTYSYIRAIVSMQKHKLCMVCFVPPEMIRENKI
jgi:hypothetical protein